MAKWYKFFFGLIASCYIVGSIQAQPIFDESQFTEFKNRAKMTVEEFQFSLSNIVNSNLQHDFRKECVNNLLKLFIGEGDPYDYYDEEADKRIHSTGVKMQITSPYKTTKQSQKLKRYIYKLYNPETGVTSLPYSKIETDAVDVIWIGDAQKTNDHYECVAYFFHKFTGFKDGKIYFDKKMVKIKCFNYGPLELPSGKVIYPVKLGDIYIVSNQKL